MFESAVHPKVEYTAEMGQLFSQPHSQLHHMPFNSLPAELRYIIAVKLYRIGWSRSLAKLALTSRKTYHAVLYLSGKLLEQLRGGEPDYIPIQDLTFWCRFFPGHSDADSLKDYAFHFRTYRAGKARTRNDLQELPVEPPIRHDPICVVMDNKASMFEDGDFCLTFRCRTFSSWIECLTVTNSGLCMTMYHPHWIDKSHQSSLPRTSHIGYEENQLYDERIVAGYGIMHSKSSLKET
jgi:hypothetical protein